MDLLKTRTCERCKTPTAVSQVRLFPKDSERNWMVCGDCLDALKNVAKTRLTNTIPSNNIAPKASSPFSTVMPSSRIDLIKNPSHSKLWGFFSNQRQNAIPTTVKKNQFCSRCNYGFNIDTSRISTVSCPYCGRMDKVMG